MRPSSKVQPLVKTLMAHSFRYLVRHSFAAPIRILPPAARRRCFRAITHPHPASIQHCGVHQKAGSEQKQRTPPLGSSSDNDNNKDNGSTALYGFGLIFFMLGIPSRRRHREEREKETSADMNGGVDLEETRD